MKISRDNYEAYFLDYHEGNLSPEMMGEVLVFVGQNPDLKEEFEEFENVSLVPDDLHLYTEKDFLKKNPGIFTGPITLANIEEYLVAETEGLLSADILAELDEFIVSNPQFEKDRRIYSHTRLVAESQIVYRQKNILKRTVLPVGSIDESNFEEFMVKEVEATITDDEAQRLTEFLAQNPRLERDRKLFGLTRLQPDESVVFPSKSSLKHTVVPLRQIVYYAMSAAASIIVLLGVYFAWDRNQLSKQVAVNRSTAVEPVVIPDLPSETYHPKTASNQAINTVVPVNEISVNNSSAASNQVASNLIVNPPQTDVRSTMPVIESLAQCEVSSKQHVDPEFLFIRQSQLYGSRYIDLYNSVKLSEQIQYASLNESDKRPLNTLWRGITGKVEERIVDDQRKNAQPAPDVSIWTLAEVGVRAYNNISHDDLELLLQKDESGKVISYALVGDKVNIERGLKQ
jgi:hypothetical protein